MPKPQVEATPGATPATLSDEAIVRDLTERLLKANSLGDDNAAQAIFASLMTIRQERRAKEVTDFVMGQFVGATTAIKAKFGQIGGKYLVDMTTDEVVKLTVTPKGTGSTLGTRAITISKEGVSHSYANGEAACRELSLDTKGGSAIVTLQAHGWKVDKQNPATP